MSEKGTYGLIALIIAFFFGESMIPPYASRALGSKNAKTARRGFVFAGLFAMVWFFVMITIGIMSRQVLPDTVGRDNVLLEVSKGFPSIFYCLIGIAIIGIIMSSLDSLLNSGGVAFSEDVVCQMSNLLKRKSFSDNKLLLGSRIGIGLISIVGCFGALKVESIIGGLLKCYSMWAPAVIPSLVYLLFIKHPHSIAAIISILTGITLPVLIEMNIIDLPFETIIVALTGSTIAIGLGHFGGKLCKY